MLYFTKQSLKPMLAFFCCRHPVHFGVSRIEWVLQCKQQIGVVLCTLLSWSGRGCHQCCCRMFMSWYCSVLHHCKIHPEHGSIVTLYIITLASPLCLSLSCNKALMLILAKSMLLTGNKELAPSWWLKLSGMFFFFQGSVYISLTQWRLALVYLFWLIT